MPEEVPKLKKRFNWEGLALAAAIVGFLLVAFDVVWAFTVAPMVNGAELTGGATAIINGVAVSNVQLFTQKIFYMHVPVAVISMILVVVGAIYGVMYLASKSPDKRKWDTRSRTCMEVGLVFIIATMATGVPWTRVEWGVWWVWEPRLITYLILMLLDIAYFVLRAAIDDPGRKARVAGVFSIIVAVDAPISYFITRLIPSSLHPVLFRTDSGLTTDMLIPFLCGIFGMMILGFAIYRLRLRMLEQAQEVEQLKLQFEEADEQYC